MLPVILIGLDLAASLRGVVPDEKESALVRVLAPP